MLNEYYNHNHAHYPMVMHVYEVYMHGYYLKLVTNQGVVVSCKWGSTNINWHIIVHISYIPIKPYFVAS